MDTQYCSDNGVSLYALMRGVCSMTIYLRSHVEVNSEYRA